MAYIGFNHKYIRPKRKGVSNRNLLWGKKPDSPNTFFSKFIEEINDLHLNGLCIDDRKISVKIKGFCCDSPAKAFILGTKGHNGYNSCTKCEQKGLYYKNRMTFPHINCTPRTHEGFLRREDTGFNTSHTPLIHVPGINFISSFPLDYMHLVCLGVMRTMLYIWILGPVPEKLPAKVVLHISDGLKALQNKLPSEFCRQPRDLDVIRRWKATEYRQFLLYTGPLILKLALRNSFEHLYENFLTLHIAMTIRLSTKHSKTHINYAKELMDRFVQQFRNIYGLKYITHNFHGLTHLADNFESFESLEDCSAFKFENSLQHIKKLVRKNEKPLPQICKRLYERSRLERFSAKKSAATNFPLYLQPQSSELLPKYINSNLQYKKVVFKEFELTTSEPNSCCKLSDGSIVLLTNIFYCNNAKLMKLLCRKFLEISDFFGDSFCKSTKLGTSVFKKLSDEIVRDVSDIVEKMVLISVENITIVVPFLH